MTHFNRRFHWWTDDVNHDREEPAHSRWPGVVFDEQVDRGGMFEENENLETLLSELKFSEEKSDISGSMWTIVPRFSDAQRLRPGDHPALASGSAHEARLSNQRT
jgi:hypothetical protein